MCVKGDRRGRIRCLPGADDRSDQPYVQEYAAEKGIRVKVPDDTSWLND